MHKLLLVIIFLLIPFRLPAFETKAPYAYLFDYSTNEVIYEKNVEERVYPSSMTKIMTLYVIFDLLKQGKLSLDDDMVISSEAAKTPGTTMFLQAGQKVKLHDLIVGIAVVSGNDASRAVAENISSSEESFAELMTQRAKDLGMNNSQFKNASGLPHPEHYSTVKDLGTLSVRIIKDFPEFYHYFSGVYFSFNGVKQRNKNLSIGYKGIDGIKTGMTDKGGYGIVASAQRNGRRLIAVVNGLQSVSERKFAAEKLLDYGFLHFSPKPLFRKGQSVAKLHVFPNEHIDAYISESIDSIYPENYEITLLYKKPLKAPINVNDNIAKLVIKNKVNDKVEEYDLFAAQHIGDPSFTAVIWQNFYEIFFNS